MAFLATPTAATAVSLAGLPLGGIQTAIAIGSVIGMVNPKHRFEKWSYRVAKINKMVTENLNHIPVQVLVNFLHLMDRFMRLQMLYEKDVNGGLKALYGQGKKNGNKFRAVAAQVCNGGLSISTMANMKRQYCELHHQNPPKNSRRQCLICFPEEISTGIRQDTVIHQNFPLTWTTFLRAQDPPTYLESESEFDENLVDSALEALPREEIRNMWHEYRALQNNEVQMEAEDYNPWVSLADLVSSRSS